MAKAQPSVLSDFSTYKSQLDMPRADQVFITVGPNMAAKPILTKCSKRHLGTGIKMHLSPTDFPDTDRTGLLAHRKSIERAQAA